MAFESETDSLNVLSSVLKLTYTVAINMAGKCHRHLVALWASKYVGDTACGQRQQGKLSCHQNTGCETWSLWSGQVLLAGDRLYNRH